MKILVVEDEQKIGNLIKKGLEEQGYKVELAFDGLSAKKIIMHRSFDLIILDLLIPYINGIELCKEIRKQNIATPVLILTALGSTDDKVTGLDSGADDYLVKPFNFNELLARIRALLRRDKESLINPVLSLDTLELNTHSKKVRRDGKELMLSAKEFMLLELLMKNERIVLSRGEIAEKVWDITFDTGTNTIDVYVNYLRNKVDKGYPVKLIHTVVGMGYVMEIRKKD